MKVIIEKNGINAHSVNDKAVISHGIAQKTELSKKSGGRIENQQVRTVGGTHKAAKADVPNGTPSVAAQKREHFAKGEGSTAHGIPKAVEIPKSSTTEVVIKGDTAAFTPKTAAIPKGEKTAKISKPQSSSSAMAHWKNRLKNKRLKLAPRKKYKVLNNGVVNNGTLTKRKARTIYNKVPEKLKKMKLKRLQKRSFKINKSQAELMQMAMGGSVSSGGGKLKKLVPMGVSGAKKVYRIAQKPVEVLKQEFYSKSDKNETGIEAAKLGLKTYDYAERGVKTAVETGVKTVKKGGTVKFVNGNLKKGKVYYYKMMENYQISKSY